MLGGSKLNEFIFQYADFANAIGATAWIRYITFPNTVAIGQNINTPQQTQQKKYQFRDDFSWNVAGMGGLGHDFKAGVNFIHQPRLFITFNTGTGDYAYTLGTNDLNGIVTNVTLNGGAADANIPNSAVRHLHPGRLAPDRSPDAEPGIPLRPHRRLGDRPDQEPELRDPPERRPRRALRGSAGVP